MLIVSSLFYFNKVLDMIIYFMYIKGLKMNKKSISKLVEILVITLSLYSFFIIFIGIYNLG